MELSTRYLTLTSWCHGPFSINPRTTLRSGWLWAAEGDPVLPGYPQMTLGPALPCPPPHCGFNQKNNLLAWESDPDSCPQQCPDVSWDLHSPAPTQAQASGLCFFRGQ